MARRERKAAENGPDRQPAKSAGVRMNPRKHAGTVANRREKAPTENSWGFNSGGGGGSRTRVRRRLTPGTTCLAHRWVSFAGSTVCEARRRTSLLDLTADRQAAIRSDPVIVTLHPRAQAQVGSGLGLKRPERSCRRWQLKVCDWINEESHPLGMHQTISQPPSKPVHPRGPISLWASTWLHKASAAKWAPCVHQAARLCWRMVRCLSRAQSRSLAAWRLS